MGVWETSMTLTNFDFQSALFGHRRDLVQMHTFEGPDASDLHRCKLADGCRALGLNHRAALNAAGKTLVAWRPKGEDWLTTLGDLKAWHRSFGKKSKSSVVLPQTCDTMLESSSS